MNLSQFFYGTCGRFFFCTIYIGKAVSDMYNFNPYQYQPDQGLIRVTGIDGARAYQMRPNSTVALFDANEDLMYIKVTDGAGFPTIRTFKFEELSPTSVSVSNFVTREEFDELRKEIENYGKQSVPEQSAD